MLVKSQGVMNRTNSTHNLRMEYKCDKCLRMRWMPCKRAATMIATIKTYPMAYSYIRQMSQNKFDLTHKLSELRRMAGVSEGLIYMNYY